MTTSGSKSFDQAWEDSAAEIAGWGLRGLQVQCPRCGRHGALISKWLKSVAVKPLYVVHSNEQGPFFDACPVDAEQAATARRGVGLSKRDLAAVCRRGRPLVLFSGGRDSLCLLHYVRRIAVRLGVEVTAIHADTTVGFPQVEEFVHEVCDRLNVKLEVVTPERDYFQLAKRWGIPGVKSRWCCETLKVAPIRRLLGQIEGPKVIFDGIRNAESYRRSTYVPVWYHPAFRCISVSPIIHWSDQEIERYSQLHALPDVPAKELGTSAECWCGAYKSRRDFNILLETNPVLFNKLVEVEEAQNGEYTFIFENGSRVPLRSLTTAVESL